jgi:hypothetical protein
MSVNLDDNPAQWLAMHGNARGAQWVYDAMDELSRLRALTTPPVDPIQVVAIGQARKLIRSLDEKIERLRAMEQRARDWLDPETTTEAEWRVAWHILGKEAECTN